MPKETNEKSMLNWVAGRVATCSTLGDALGLEYMRPDGLWSVAESDAKAFCYYDVLLSQMWPSLGPPMRGKGAWTDRGILGSVDEHSVLLALSSFERYVKQCAISTKPKRAERLTNLINMDGAFLLEWLDRTRIAKHGMRITMGDKSKFVRILIDCEHYKPYLFEALIGEA